MVMTLLFWPCNVIQLHLPYIGSLPADNFAPVQWFTIPEMVPPGSQNECLEFIVELEAMVKLFG